MAEVTLEFLGRQIERLLTDNASFKDDMMVLTAMVVARIDSSHSALLTEMRALHSKVSRIETRLSKLEEHA